MTLKSTTYKCISAINAVNNSLRLPVIALIFIMSLITTYSVIMRYAFNAPPRWSLELNINMLAVIIFISGGYVLFRDSHIRVDLIYGKLSLRQRVIIDLIAFALVGIFCLALIVEGWDIAFTALKQGRGSLYSMGWPTFPAMVMMPIGGILLLLQAIVKVGCDIATLVTGQEVTRWKAKAALEEKLK